MSSFFTLDGELQLGGRVMQRNASDVAKIFKILNLKI